MTKFLYMFLVQIMAGDLTLRLMEIIYRCLLLIHLIQLEAIQLKYLNSYEYT